jgi:hypothetical protein
MVGNEERQMARNFQGEVEVSNPNDDGLRFSHDYEKENNNVIYEGNRRKQKYNNNNNKYNNNYIININYFFFDFES